MKDRLRVFERAHIASGRNPIRLSDETNDLEGDPELWASLYWEHRDEILRHHGAECEAAKKFEPELMDEDDDDDSDEE